MATKRGVETSSLLIPQSDLRKYLEEVTRKEKGIVEDLRTIIPYVKDETLKVSLQRRLSRGEECLTALEAGFVPVDSGFFTKVDTKSKWQKKMVKETLDSMPEEVKEVWDKVKALGVFDAFSVTTRGGGDPLLVGNRGGKHFFIAGWLPICQGVGLGIKLKLP